jgi:hypothetical protein
MIRFIIPILFVCLNLNGQELGGTPTYMPKMTIDTLYTIPIHSLMQYTDSAVVIIGGTIVQIRFGCIAVIRGGAWCDLFN